MLTCVLLSTSFHELREKLRSVAFKIQETKAQRPKFKDIVKFVNNRPR